MNLEGVESVLENFVNDSGVEKLFILFEVILLIIVNFKAIKLFIIRFSLGYVLGNVFFVRGGRGGRGGGRGGRGGRGRRLFRGVVF